MKRHSCVLCRDTTSLWLHLCMKASLSEMLKDALLMQQATSGDGKCLVRALSKAPRNRCPSKSGPGLGLLAWLGHDAWHEALEFPDLLSPCGMCRGQMARTAQGRIGGERAQMGKSPPCQMAGARLYQLIIPDYA